MNRHCGLEQSPMQSLPTEIISLIAYYAAGIRHTAHPLWLMTHICSRWRQVVINDPRIWCLRPLEVHFPSASQPEMFNTVLARSGSMPIRISMNVHTETVLQCLDLLDTASARCSHLDLALTTMSAVQVIQSNTVFPNLRHMRLRASYDQYARGAVVPKYWQNLSMLEELVLDLSVKWTGPFPVIHRLKRVNVRVVNDASNVLYDLRNLLTSSTAVVEVELQAKRCRISWTPSPRVAINTSVETLFLADFGTRFLNYVALPALRSLALDGTVCHYDRRWNVNRDYIVPDIIAFLDRSNCPLEEFTLSLSQLSPSRLPSVLLQMPSLKTLKLRVELSSDLTFLEELFDALAVMDYNDTFDLLPLLEKLTIHLRHNNLLHNRFFTAVKEINEHLVDMVCARTAVANPSLRLVRIVIDPEGFCGLSDSQVKVLEHCEACVEGLDIVIQDQNNTFKCISRINFFRSAF
ncbi:hypothetical protein BDZ89DRAFT_1069334 [Hymenopellis radicata]|nr:hypothetical protein BDZ89DRAFT_1069334 [Hymenopellis radicata]